MPNISKDRRHHPQVRIKMARMEGGKSRHVSSRTPPVVVFMMEWRAHGKTSVITVHPT